MTAVSGWLKVSPSRATRLGQRGKRIPRAGRWVSRMGRRIGLASLVMLISACTPGPSSAFAVHSPSPSSAPTVASPSPSPAESPSPAASPAPVPEVACKGGAGAASMVLLSGAYGGSQLLYDVSDPVHPRLLCTIAN